MNKKGFTLVELIIVITLIAMVSLLATPNVIQMVENGNKDKMVADANNFFDDVMYKYSLEKYKDFYPTDNNDCEEIRADNPIFAIDLDEDYAGNEYDKEKSRVMVCLEDDTYKYYIKLASKDKSGNYVNMISEKEDDYEYVLFEDLDRSKVRKYKNKEDKPIIPEEEIPVVPEEKTKTAYAVYSVDDNSLTFYKTTDTITKGETYNSKIVTDVYTGFETVVYSYNKKAPWHDYASSITSVTFNDEISPISTAYWFEDFKNSSFKTIDLSKLNTTNVTNMNDMFVNCEFLETITFGNNWDTSNVTKMAYMFDDCKSLKSLNLSSWNTQNVTNMQGMFMSCESLTSLNLSNWNTKNVVYMHSLFHNCSKLTNITFGDGWDTTNVVNMSSVFDGCKSLKILNLSSWNTENVMDMRRMFFGCNSLTSVGDIISWNTQNVTNMSNMFYKCFSLTNLNLSNWNTQSVTNMSNMFWECTSLKTLNVSGWNTQNVTNMKEMFFFCKALTSLNLSSWNTQNVTNMSGMFTDCNSLTSFGDISGWDTQNVTDMGAMFMGCWKIKNFNLSSWNIQNVTDMYGMFSDCISLTSLNLSGWNTQNVTDMHYMFYNCSNLKSITFGDNWNTYNVTNMEEMFLNCDYLTLDCSKWNVDKVTKYDNFDEYLYYDNVTYKDIKNIKEPNWVN